MSVMERRNSMGLPLRPPVRLSGTGAGLSVGTSTAGAATAGAATVGASPGTSGDGASGTGAGPGGAGGGAMGGVAALGVSSPDSSISESMASEPTRNSFTAARRMPNQTGSSPPMRCHSTGSQGSVSPSQRSENASDIKRKQSFKAFFQRSFSRSSSTVNPSPRGDHSARSHVSRDSHSSRSSTNSVSSRSGSAEEEKQGTPREHSLAHAYAPSAVAAAAASMAAASAGSPTVISSSASPMTPSGAERDARRSEGSESNGIDVSPILQPSSPGKGRGRHSESPSGSARDDSGSMQSSESSSRSTVRLRAGSFRGAYSNGRRSIRKSVLAKRDWSLESILSIGNKQRAGELDAVDAKSGGGGGSGGAGGGVDGGSGGGGGGSGSGGGGVGGQSPLGMDIRRSVSNATQISHLTQISHTTQISQTTAQSNNSESLESATIKRSSSDCSTLGELPDGPAGHRPPPTLGLAELSLMESVFDGQLIGIHLHTGAREYTTHSQANDEKYNIQIEELFDEENGLSLDRIRGKDVGWTKQIHKIQQPMKDGSAMYFRARLKKMSASHLLVVIYNITDTILHEESVAAARLEAERTAARHAMEKQRMEMERQEVERRAEADLAHLRTFVFHEIGNLATGLFAIRHELKDSVDNERVPSKACISNFEAHIHSMQEVLRNITSITKLSTPGYIEPVEAFNVESILNEVVSLVQPRSNVPIRVSVDHPSGYDVVGYKFMVKTCLYNLVGNSAKFTTNGHIELYASVVHDAGAHSHTNGPHNATSKSPNNKALGAARLHVTVEDTGRGIPEEKRAKLFAFGEQVHAGDSGAGSGLGLAFVHRACSELFHSSPIVESQVGVGTKISLEVPLKKSAYDSFSPASMTPTATGQLARNGSSPPNFKFRLNRTTAKREKPLFRRDEAQPGASEEGGDEEGKTATTVKPAKLVVRRCLICDDQATGRQMLRLLLSQVLPPNWEIHEVKNGEAAIELAGKIYGSGAKPNGGGGADGEAADRGFDLVTMDQNMQGSGGKLTGCESILQLLSLWPATVVVGITASSYGSKEVEMLMEAGCREVWGKPPPNALDISMALFGDAGSLNNNRGGNSNPSLSDAVPNAAPGRASGSGSMVVMIVDDSAVCLKAMASVLSTVCPTHCEVITASTGEEGVRLASSLEVDVCFMDFHLSNSGGKLNGAEATAQLMSAHPGMKVIGATSNGSKGEPERELMLESGCIEVLQKPVRTDELGKTLRDLQLLPQDFGASATSGGRGGGGFGGAGARANNRALVTLPPQTPPSHTQGDGYDYSQYGPSSVNDEVLNWDRACEIHGSPTDLYSMLNDLLSDATDCSKKLRLAVDDAERAERVRDAANLDLVKRMKDASFAAHALKGIGLTFACDKLAAISGSMEKKTSASNGSSTDLATPTGTSNGLSTSNGANERAQRPSLVNPPGSSTGSSMHFTHVGRLRPLVEATEHEMANVVRRVHEIQLAAETVHGPGAFADDAEGPGTPELERVIERMFTSVTLSPVGTVSRIDGDDRDDPHSPKASAIQRTPSRDVSANAYLSRLEEAYDGAGRGGGGLSGNGRDEDAPRSLGSIGKTPTGDLVAAVVDETTRERNRIQRLSEDLTGGATFGGSALGMGLVGIGGNSQAADLAIDLSDEEDMDSVASSTSASIDCSLIAGMHSGISSEPIRHTPSLKALEDDRAHSPTVEKDAADEPDAAAGSPAPPPARRLVEPPRRDGPSAEGGGAAGGEAGSETPRWKKEADRANDEATRLSFNKRPPSGAPRVLAANETPPVTDHRRLQPLPDRTPAGGLSPISNASTPTGGHDGYDRILGSRAHSSSKSGSVPAVLLTSQVLVVEDSKSARKTMARMLKRQGITAEFAENGLDAVSRINRNEVFKLVLMDKEMPAMNGIQATQIIHGSQPALPIMGLSAHDDDTSHAEFLNAGAIGMITKPLKPSDLSVIAEQFL